MRYILCDAGKVIFLTLLLVGLEINAPNWCNKPMTPDYSALQDEAVVIRVQAGDTAAFGVLISRYEQKMARYAGKFLYNLDDAKDAVQEIFTKAYVHINSFDSSRKFSPWLYRIAHNELVNMLKKRSKQAWLPLFDLDVFFPQYAKKESAITQEMERKEMRQLVEESLEKLPPKYKEVVILYYLEDFSYKEIADVLRLPVSTVGVRINRAKTMMKKLFKNPHGKQ